MIEKLEKLEGRITKLLDSKMDNFIELGMDDGGSIYVEKGIFTTKFTAGLKGTFQYHRALWGRNKREVRILDGYSVPLPPPKVDTTHPQPQLQLLTTGQSKTIQEIHNEDFIEFQRRTERTTGKTDQRDVFVSLDSVRIHGDLSNEKQIKDKIDLFFKHKEYFENTIKKKAEVG